MRERAANVQRQHLKDFRKPRELLLKTALSFKLQENLLGGKILRNEGRLKTFAQYCICTTSLACLDAVLR